MDDTILELMVVYMWDVPTRRITKASTRVVDIIICIDIQYAHNATQRNGRNATQMKLTYINTTSETIPYPIIDFT